VNLDASKMIAAAIALAVGALVYFLSARRVVAV
jgi:hypothetical protein